MKTKKLKVSKTGVELLLRAAGRSCGHVGTCFYGGRGSQGGRVSGGNQEARAAAKLRDLGLFVLMRTSETREAERGWTVHYYSADWMITIKGRRIAANLEEIA